MRPSLEEERRALLAQIEASRAVYRRMLSGTPEATKAPAAYDARDNAPMETRTGFPRSLTVRWMLDHPLAVAAGVALLVWVAPRWWASGERSKSGKSDHRERSRQYAIDPDRRETNRHIPVEGTGRALLTAATLMVRNPATMRVLSRAASLTWRWLQQRRAHRSSIH